MSKPTLLKMTNISKSFASNVVLKGIELTVDEGQVVALLGENGAGKSTLIKILGGIYKADGGEIYINGEKKSINSVSEAGENGIRIIHQEIILVPDRTVAANVFLGREYRSKLGFIDYKRMEQETQHVIDELDLNLDASALVKDLSIGMQQLVEIIKAVSAEARLVVMDEPTSSLSQGETETLFRIIKVLQEKGVGIIYISHRLDELFRITDRIMIMRDGNTVGNVLTKEAQREALINLMVGRELKDYYTRSEHAVLGCSLEVQGLSHDKYFKDISFKANYGEIVGFAGLVGARRTELMKTIFGAYAKTDGQILLDGKPIRIKKPKDAIDAGIVYISEDRRGEGLVLLNDVEFNMGLVCLDDFVKGIRVNKTAWKRMVDEYRRKFSIKITSPQQKAGLLSGGNQQKVVLSKWLAKKPKVIILDEPTRGIDVGSKSEIYAIIDELAANGVSIIMVSSELPEIINMCNRCYIMCEGNITGEITQDEFSQETIMTYATNRS
ncbi:MAG: sugar ABC transporter ATP-binding protein [Lachnospiraceae bacterium]